jgi:hypothetical protein
MGADKCIFGKMEMFMAYWRDSVPILHSDGWVLGGHLRRTERQYITIQEPSDSTNHVSIVSYAGMSNLHQHEPRKATVKSIISQAM